MKSSSVSALTTAGTSEELAPNTGTFAAATATPLWLPRTDVVAVIQCAMDMEAAPFLAAMTADSREALLIGEDAGHQQSFVFGNFEGHRVLVVTSGVGIANAASATARALMLAHPAVVIAAGTTGGLHIDSRVGDIAIGVSAVYHNADATAFGYERGQIPSMPHIYAAGVAATVAAQRLPVAIAHRVIHGQVVSGDSFITADIVTPIREAFPEAIATDMETTAMAQIAWSMGTDWISLRAVSDLCGPVAGQDFHIDGAEAAACSVDAVRAYLPLFVEAAREAQ